VRERLAHELDLTPEQRRRVDSLLGKQMADFRRIREEMQPRFDSLLVQAQARLDSVLTPAQRERLKTLRAREAFGPRDSFGMRELRPPPFP
jgi:Spy/CpxP family protein refolding chaperone